MSGARAQPAPGGRSDAKVSAQGILFDLDGTLVDSLGDIATAVNLTRGDFGLGPLPRPEITRLVGDGSAALVAKTVPVPPADAARALERYLAHYAAHLLDTTRLFPGVDALLQALAPRRLAVVESEGLLSSRSARDSP